MTTREKLNAAERVRPPIEIGERYAFHSTAMTQENVTPWSGQECVVVGPVLDVDDECEPIWTVRFDDGHEAPAFEGELDGWYFESEQCVEFWRNDPNFADQILPPKVPWHASSQTVVEFGRWLFEKGHLDTADDVLSYFEKPWKWTPEYDEYRTEVDGTIGRVHEH